MAGRLLALGKTSGRWGFMGMSALFRAILKHWYIFLLIIFVLPSVITSIQVAFETQNPLHPFLDLGKRIFTADVALGDDVDLLRENPAEFYGATKPDSGIWQGVKYKSKIFWGWYRLIGNIYLIFIPLVFIYRIVKYRNISEINKNITFSIVIFAIYLFIVNILFVMFRIVTGETVITLPEGISEFQQILALFIHLIPLNGLINFFTYIFQLASGTV